MNTFHATPDEIKDVKVVKALEAFSDKIYGTSVNKDERFTVIEVHPFAACYNPSAVFVSIDPGNCGMFQTSYIEEKTVRVFNPVKVFDGKGDNYEEGRITDLAVAAATDNITISMMLLENSANPFITFEGEMPIDLCEDLLLKSCIQFYMNKIQNNA